MRAWLLLLLFAGRVWAANCGGYCIPGHGSITGFKGIKKPNNCVCDWEIPQGDNWDLFNGDGYVHWVNVANPAFGTLGSGNDTSIIQAAIATCKSPVVFPKGTYTACGIVPVCSTQQWVGAEGGSAALVGTAGCTAIIGSSASSGPFGSIRITGFTISGSSGSSASLIGINGRDGRRLEIDHNRLDVCQSGFTTQNRGITSLGIASNIHDNEIYSSCPPNGQGVLYDWGSSGAFLHHNTFKGLYAPITVVGNDSGYSLTDIEIDHNYIDSMWWANPTLPNMKGIAETYTSSSLTDNDVTFTNLCNTRSCNGGVNVGLACTSNADCPAATCICDYGTYVRSMVARITSTTSSNYDRAGIIRDSGSDFQAAGVTRGDLMRTTTRLCNGGGSRLSCSGSLKGADCSCTADGQCASGACRYRFATVNRVETGIANTDISIYDEWMDDGDGANVMGTRRPVAPPANGTQVAVYAWRICQIISYTDHVITCNTIAGRVKGWNDYLGNKTAPTNGDAYEVVSRAPYIGLGVYGAVSYSKLTNNTVLRAGDDSMGVGTGSYNTISGNVIRDGTDHGLVVGGEGNTVSGGQVEHNGFGGLGVFGPRNTIVGVAARNNCWAFVDNTDLGCADVYAGPFGGSNADGNIFDGMQVELNISLANAKQGILVKGQSGGTSVGNIVKGSKVNGSYSVASIRVDPLTGSVTDTSLLYNNGASVSDNSSTRLLVKDPLLCIAQGSLPAWQLGSEICVTATTVANPCAGGASTSIGRRIGGPAWACN